MAPLQVDTACSSLTDSLAALESGEARIAKLEAKLLQDAAEIAVLGEKISVQASDLYKSSAQVQSLDAHFHIYTHVYKERHLHILSRTLYKT